MQKKEFFGVLLLVSLVSSVMFAGVALSNGAPAISIYPATGITASSDVYIRVTGTGWASAPVTLYWDQQTDDHVVAIVTPSTYGSFRLDQLEIESVPIGLHTIIAVQGLSKATATYTVTATLPPDDRLLGPIQQIENKLDNTTWGLPGIQSNFTTVLTNVAAIEGKLDPSGRLGNTTQMSSKNDHYKSAGQSGYIITCQASKTAEFTITYSAWSNVSSSDVYLVLWNGTIWTTVSETLVSWNGYMYYLFGTITVAAKGIQLAWTNPGTAEFASDWFITVQAPPDTTITFS